jgi:uncharacterized membrane protein YheB (UPF0754 family)
MKILLMILIPPVAGAFIGFITNVIAIKMLFRPLKEYRIFGLRIPFTPGILPRQRHKIAENIGAMVERELFTPELLRERLSQDDVRRKLRESVSVFTEKLLARPLEDFFNVPVAAETTNMFSALTDSLFGSPLIQTVTQTIVRRICAEAETHYPRAVTAVIGFLRQDNIRKNLEIHGQRIITELMLSFSVFQRFFITVGQYEQNIREQMPEIINKLISQAEKLLESEEVRRQALDFFHKFITANVSANKIPGDIFKEIKESVLNKHANEPLGTLLSVNRDSKHLLDDFLCSQLLRLVYTEIEGVLKSVNVREMVTQRIDALDMIHVEQIILDVMANQLKWINLFGGILGFLIGFFQVLINFILR